MKKLIVGNWKMNKAAGELSGFFTELAAENIPAGISWGIAASAVHLAELKKLSEKFGFLASAQNVHEAASGAFTGEISWPMLEGGGISWSLLGHSERRTYFGETDVSLAKKVKAAAGKSVIFCIGETLQERELNLTEAVIARQIDVGLESKANVANLEELVLAYEPVWAIGTGKASSVADAEKVHGFIREKLKTRFGQDVSAKTRILYGGSVTAANAKSYFTSPLIDGALVGGASLKPKDFAEILRGAV